MASQFASMAYGGVNHEWKEHVWLLEGRIFLYYKGLLKHFGAVDLRTMVTVTGTAYYVYKYDKTHIHHDGLSSSMISSS